MDAVADPNNAPAALHVPQFQFVARLIAVPLVASLLDRVSKIYNEAKTRLSLVGALMKAAESTTAITLLVCAPVLRVALSRQLQHADAFACRVLDELEQRCPIAFRHPDEIIADVIALGREKAAQLKACVNSKVTAIRALVEAAANVIFHPVATLKSLFRMIWIDVHLAVLMAEHRIDMLIYPYDRRHNPFFNNVIAEVAVCSRICTVLRKLRTLAKFVFWYRTRRLLERRLFMWGLALNDLHYTLSHEALGEAFDDPALATVQHAFLLLVTLADRLDLAYFCFYAHVFGYYHLWVTLPEPPNEMFRALALADWSPEEDINEEGLVEDIEEGLIEDIDEEGLVEEE
ncbi:uncharacterized protein LOC119450870 isoform X2 [Dermacentor silvarum]|uniref:uncharacterized protein LOC119450870 isoform X2 n=1 Tax=Dermacentor silvarum TaxID=543639 RepID=UPI0021015085|nr:uncharacterized protein LOC119450870 isoform X2 [Dermacentor silvarum]